MHQLVGRVHCYRYCALSPPTFMSVNIFRLVVLSEANSFCTCYSCLNSELRILVCITKVIAYAKTEIACAIYECALSSYVHYRQVLLSRSNYHIFNMVNNNKLFHLLFRVWRRLVELCRYDYDHILSVVYSQPKTNDGIAIDLNSSPWQIQHVQHRPYLCFLSKLFLRSNHYFSFCF